ncbi:MAG TPA: hypothetical protein PKD48_01795 [Sphingopyxis sp.]|nr:hypothetical protein [Sphingopyxis sp.]
MTYVPIASCRAAPWHFDEPHIARDAYGRRVSEISIQAGIVTSLPLIVPCMVAAVPNGTWTPSKAARGRAVQEGTAAGYPDLIIDGIGPNAGRVCRAEIKALSDVSPDQFAKLNDLTANGHLCGVFRSLLTLVAFLVANGWQSRASGWAEERF